MSVINQVLNQLEQRGAHSAAEQVMVRAVPHVKRTYTLPLLAFGVALVTGIAVWQWVETRKPDAAPTGKAGNFSGVDGHEKSAPQPRPAEMAAPVAPATNTSALRLSFELSSVPLPTAIRQGPGQASTNLGQASTSSGQALRQGSGLALTEEKNIPENTEVAARPATATAKSSSTKTDAKAAAQAPKGALPMKQVSPAQQADAEFRKAAALMQQGRIADALAGYEAALRLDAAHDAARQALVALLLEGKRGGDAEQVLQERLKSKPDHTGFAMLLARLQVERGAVAEATATLETALPYANAQADFQAFLAALLQRQNRNEEAVAHYQVALQLAPGNGIWLMGCGISMQALQRNAEAKEMFQRSLDTKTLNPELQAFVQQKLKGL